MKILGADPLPLDLVPIVERDRARSQGSWRVGGCDDEHNMNAVYVYSGDGPKEVYPDAGLVRDQGRSVVAVTLYQEPRIADHADGKWDANAEFIAGASEDVPALVAEVTWLRREVALSHSFRRGFGPGPVMCNFWAPCRVCVAARADGWDPTRAVDWRPDTKSDKTKP